MTTAYRSRARARGAAILAAVAVALALFLGSAPASHAQSAGTASCTDASGRAVACAPSSSSSSSSSRSSSGGRVPLWPLIFIAVPVIAWVQKRLGIKGKTSYAVPIIDADHLAGCRACRNVLQYATSLPEDPNRPGYILPTEMQIRRIGQLWRGCPRIKASAKAEEAQRKETHRQREAGRKWFQLD